MTISETLSVRLAHIAMRKIVMPQMAIACHFSRPVFPTGLMYRHTISSCFDTVNIQLSLRHEKTLC